VNITREILSELGLRWKNLDEETKAPYEAAAAQERVRYHEEITRWRQEHPREPGPFHDRRKKMDEEGTLYYPVCFLGPPWRSEKKSANLILCIHSRNTSSWTDCLLLLLE